MWNFQFYHIQFSQAIRMFFMNLYEISVKSYLGLGQLMKQGRRVDMVSWWKNRNENRKCHNWKGVPYGWYGTNIFFCVIFEEIVLGVRRIFV